MVPRADVLRLLPGALSRLAANVSPPRQRCIEDSFLDTDDLALASAGAALRLRTERGHGAEITLKALRPMDQGLAVRPELSERLHHLSHSHNGSCPGRRVARRVRQLIGDQPLRVRFRLAQERSVYTLCTRRGARLLVSVDTVRLTGRRRPIREIEVEWIAGPAGELTRASKTLRRLLGLEPAMLSKYELGLRAAGLRCPVHADPSLPRTAGISEALARALRMHLARLRHHADGVRLDLDPEFVHDMRVAGRRIRAALKALNSMAGVEVPRRLHDEVRRLTGQLGTVRDLDVHGSAIATRAASLPPAQAPAARAYLARLRRQRARAHARLLAALGSSRFAELVRELEILAAGLESSASRHAAEPAGPAARPVIRRLFERVRRQGRKADDHASDDYLHQLRIRCKRLRYACEFLQDVCGPDLASFTEQVAHLQQVLGRHQDVTVEKTLLRRFLRTRAAHRDRVVGHAVRMLLADIAADRKETRHHCINAWRKFDRRTTRLSLRALLK